jgi:hypothetical protein
VSSQQWPIPPSERRRRGAEMLYELEMLLREEGYSDFIYDEEKDLFRFRDGRFAFLRTQADMKVLLEERGYSA